MRIGYYLLIAPVIVSSCSLWTPNDDLASRPFEVNVKPTILHLGDRVDVSYRYLGPADRHYRILFGTDSYLPETMLELGVPTSDPGTFSFVLAPRMVDRRDASRGIDVTPGKSYGVGFVGYKNGEEFGFSGGPLLVLDASGSPRE
ncbi:MAG TPA: hypothetical protein V6D05_15235 [Stenomitos sp.]